MKEYKNIGDLFKDNFENYSPQPPKKVWENVLSKVSKPRVSIYKVVVSSVISLAVVSGLVISIVKYIQINEDKSLIQSGTISAPTNPLTVSIDKHVEKNKNFNKTNQNTIHKITSQNSINHNTDEQIEEEPLIENGNTHISVPEIETINKNNYNYIIEKESISSNIAVVQKNETIAPIISNVLISKDTTVCENSMVTLFIRNAKNIVWSNGKTDENIVVQVDKSEMFFVSFTNQNGKDTMANIHVKCVPCSELIIPSAFTPNGDGLNDEFKIYASGDIKSYELIIYNKSNKEVFRTNDINKGWDGTFMRTQQSHGLYFYIVRYQDSFNRIIERKGEFLLLKK